MKAIFILLFSFCYVMAIAQSQHVQKEYNLFIYTKEYFQGHKKKLSVMHANEKDIKKLNEPLRALAAYYSASVSSNCIDSIGHQFCILTSALGLGEQGSDAHRNILSKWFPYDTIVKEMLDRNCYVIAPGASIFNEYHSLKFKVNRDTVVISYKVGYYNHGRNKYYNVKDIAVIEKNKIVFIAR